MTSRKIRAAAAYLVDGDDSLYDHVTQSSNHSELTVVNGDSTLFTKQKPLLISDT